MRRRVHSAGSEGCIRLTAKPQVASMLGQVTTPENQGSDTPRKVFIDYEL
jgi:hypothetical protein